MEDAYMFHINFWRHYLYWIWCIGRVDMPDVHQPKLTVPSDEFHYLYTMRKRPHPRCNSKAAYSNHLLERVTNPGEQECIGRIAPTTFLCIPISHGIRPCRQAAYKRICHLNAEITGGISLRPDSRGHQVIRRRFGIEKTTWWPCESGLNMHSPMISSLRWMIFVRRGTSGSPNQLPQLALRTSIVRVLISIWNNTCSCDTSPPSPHRFHGGSATERTPTIWKGNLWQLVVFLNIYGHKRQVTSVLMKQNS
jgi:hypothetical protein